MTTHRTSDPRCIGCLVNDEPREGYHLSVCPMAPDYNGGEPAPTRVAMLEQRSETPMTRAVAVGGYVVIGQGMGNAGRSGHVDAIEDAGMHGPLHVIYDGKRYVGRYYAKDLIPLTQRRESPRPLVTAEEHDRVLEQYREAYLDRIELRGEIDELKAENAKFRSALGAIAQGIGRGIATPLAQYALGLIDNDGKPVSPPCAGTETAETNVGVRCKSDGCQNDRIDLTGYCAEHPRETLSSGGDLNRVRAWAQAFFEEHWDTYHGHPVEALALLLDEAEDRARDEEREACAKALAPLINDHPFAEKDVGIMMWNGAVSSAMATIRARTTHPKTCK